MKFATRILDQFLRLKKKAARRLRMAAHGSTVAAPPAPDLDSVPDLKGSGPVVAKSFQSSGTDQLPTDSVHDSDESVKALAGSVGSVESVQAMIHHGSDSVQGSESVQGGDSINGSDNLLVLQGLISPEYENLSVQGSNHPSLQGSINNNVSVNGSAQESMASVNRTLGSAQGSMVTAPGSTSVASAPAPVALPAAQVQIQIPAAQGLMAQVTSLSAQVTSLTAQVTSLSAQVTTLSTQRGNASPEERPGRTA